MRHLAILLIVILPATSALANQYWSYSWEDGEGTILGTPAPNLIDWTNVSGPQTGQCGDCPSMVYTCPGAFDGMRYVHVAEYPHSGNPIVWLAWVKGLVDGDEIYCHIYVYDQTVGTSPSMRLWATYTVDDEMGSDGSPPVGSPSEYSQGNGWEQLEQTWVFSSSGLLTDVYDGAIIQIRVYSSPSTGTYRTDYWMDDLLVGFPEHAVVYFPSGSATVEGTTWSGVKALFR